jgi:hypothetical protein
MHVCCKAAKRNKFYQLRRLLRESSSEFCLVKIQGESCSKLTIFPGSFNQDLLSKNNWEENSSSSC